MNVVLLMGLGLVGLFGMWLVQTLTLKAVGHDRPFAWPLRHGSDSQVVRWVMKAAIQLVMASLVIAAPWLSGVSFLEYYKSMVVPARWGLLAATMGVTLCMFLTSAWMYVQLGMVKFEPQYGLAKSLGKMFRASLPPLPLAIAEETLFRGVILEQLLRALPETTGAAVLALTVSAAIFSSLHFLRKQKRVLLPALGLFMLGFTLGMVYIETGHSLWLAVAIHAAGIWYTQLSRPFLSYQGPAWFVGYRSYPICGAMGYAGMWFLVAWSYMIV
jgi:hypothetical protein